MNSVGQTSRILFEPSTSKNSKNKKFAVKPVLNGRVIIDRPHEDSTFPEQVRIGISIRSGKKRRSTQDWVNLIQRKPLLTAFTRSFQIDQKYWFTKGISWIIPTPIFETTTITIELEPSALLSTGFIVEIHRRDSTIIHEVEPGSPLSSGATINFGVNWNLLTAAATASPTVRSRGWQRGPCDTYSSELFMLSEDSE